MQQIVILGGGAAGMAAALAAAQAAAQAAGSAARITLLDRNPRCGKKLLATGNGRCNLFQIACNHIVCNRIDRSVRIIVD